MGYVARWYLASVSGPRASVIMGLGASMASQPYTDSAAVIMIALLPAGRQGPGSPRRAIRRPGSALRSLDDQA